MTWRCCSTARWASCSTSPTPRRRWVRSCARSPSATSARLDAVASRLLTGLAKRTDLLPGLDGTVLVDVDDSIVEVHGHAKQGAGFGYTRARVEHAAGHGQHRLGRADGRRAAAAQGLVRITARREAAGRGRAEDSPFAASRPGHRTGAGAGGLGLLRQPHDRRCGPCRRAGLRDGPDDPEHQAAIASIADDAWTTIEYTDAIRDEDTGELISSAEVAEVGFTAFASATRPTGCPDGWSCAEYRTSTPPPIRTRLRCSSLALPRLLHHQRPRGPEHGRGGQDPPRTRDHRAGPRRPQEQRPGAPSIREVPRQQRLARPGRHGVQPHPRCRHLGRRPVSHVRRPAPSDEP